MNPSAQSDASTDELAKQLVLERGAQGARRLFNETFDPALIFAILEQIESEAASFNSSAKQTTPGQFPSRSSDKKQE